MAALAAGPVRISTARLRAQAGRGPAAPAGVVTPSRSSRAVPAVVLATTALLVAAAAWPGTGSTGSGTATVATPVSVAQAAVGPTAPTRAVALPGTGADDATTTPAAHEDAAVPARAVSSCTGPCSTSQVVSVRVLPGTLSLGAAPSAVTLDVAGDGTGRGRLSRLRVTDLRGSGTGWALTTLVAAVIDVSSGLELTTASVDVTPACRLTAGPLTLTTAPPSRVPVGGTASLCLVPVASQGSLAGGVVEADAGLVVRGAPAGARVRVVVQTSLT